MTTQGEKQDVFSRLEGLFIANPSISCYRDEDKNVFFVEQFLSLDKKVYTTVIRSKAGYSTVTMLMPPIEVPEESVGRVMGFMNDRNSKYIRGCLVLDKNRCVRFDNYIPLDDGDSVSDGTLLTEVLLGTRILLQTVGDVLSVIDGEEVEDNTVNRRDVESETYVPKKELPADAGAMYR